MFLSAVYTGSLCMLCFLCLIRVPVQCLSIKEPTHHESAILSFLYIYVHYISNIWSFYKFTLASSVPMEAVPERKLNAAAARLGMIVTKTGLPGAPFCPSCSNMISYPNRNHNIAILR